LPARAEGIGKKILKSLKPALGDDRRGLLTGEALSQNCVGTPLSEDGSNPVAGVGYTAAPDPSEQHTPCKVQNQAAIFLKQ
jgi:hypothetical protein